MIAKAKSISHGIRAILYVSGESRNKKHPEKITRICDNFMPQGMDASGIWTEMKFATMDRPDIKNNVIRGDGAYRRFYGQGLAAAVERLRGGFRQSGNSE